jgi:hypothetical protein
MLLVATAVIGGCSSSHSANQVASPTSSSRGARLGFCDLYRRDTHDGHLRNWNLTENAKTVGYVVTLRGLADAAPPDLRPDINRILSYYVSPEPRLSPADYEAGLQSGERVLRYVQQTCHVDTESSPPPGDASTTTP